MKTSLPEPLPSLGLARELLRSSVLITQLMTADSIKAVTSRMQTTLAAQRHETIAVPRTFERRKQGWRRSLAGMYMRIEGQRQPFSGPK